MAVRHSLVSSIKCFRGRDRPPLALAAAGSALVLEARYRAARKLSKRMRITPSSTRISTLRQATVISQTATRGNGYRDVLCSAPIRCAGYRFPRESLLIGP